jgi:hypothetical protein
MTYFTFLNAVLLSGVAAYYSVIGLASIFPGAFWPVVLMGSVLECSKLITTSWLYRNWLTAPKILKYYLTMAVIILMLITSMGIFGYLSKAHLEHATDVGPVSDKITIIDEKINTLKENVDSNKLALKQLDAAVNNIMTRTEDARGAERSVQVRKTQQKERSQISEEIANQQKEISKLVEEKAPLANELRKAESDFGPIKYVAELVYGSGDKDIIDKAVRLVIMLIMIVFDPLAVLLLIASNISSESKPKKEVVIEKPVVEPVITPIPEPPLKVPESEILQEKKEPDSVSIHKENLIVIDEASGETIPPLSSDTSSKRGFPNRKTKLESYEYEESPLAFKEKEDK